MESTVIVAILAHFYSSVNGNCNTVGKSRCSPYDTKWETCLTKEYITDKTKGDMSCPWRNQTSCWFPCEKEIYSYEDSGTECSCEDSDDLPANILPPSCSSPNEQACTWYSSCLTKSKCYLNFNTQALTGRNYSEHVCKMFQSTTKYSKIEYSWFKGVVRCFQVAFVPFLRPWAQQNCHKISNTLHTALSDCYIQNTNGTPSLCDLEEIDWGKQFSIILKWIEVNKILVERYLDYYHPFYNMVKAFDQCDVPITLSNSSTSMILIRPYVVALKNKQEDYPIFLYQYDATEKISNKISNLDLNIKGGKRVFVYPENITKVSVGFELSAIIIIVSKLENVSQTSINMTSAHQKLISLIQIGKMEFSGRQFIQIRSMNVCYIGMCEQFNFTYTPRKPVLSTKPDDGVQSLLIWIILASVLVVLVSFFICIIRCNWSVDMDVLNQIGMANADREVGTDEPRQEGDGLEHEEGISKDDLESQGPIGKQELANKKTDDQKNVSIDSSFFF